jgi:hypothetical protein
MKRSGIYGLFFSVTCCIMCKVPYTQDVYIASTPANLQIRTFLGIPQNDSIDFIRWELSFSNHDSFIAKVNYGIGQPNTSGFIQGGKHLTINGSVTNKGNGHQLIADNNASLSLIKVNNNLLHVMDADGSLLAGNDGWNNMLSKKDPGAKNEKINGLRSPSPDKIKGVYAGRTPCNELVKEYTIDAPGDCIKLKWLLTLNRDKKTNQPSSFTLNYTLHRSSIVEGTWSISNDNILQLFYNGRLFVKMLAADSDVLIFVDKQNRLFNGNENFSYAINKR